MKKVKFNVDYMLHMIPDTQIEKLRKKFNDMQDNELMNYDNNIAPATMRASYLYPQKKFKADEVAEIFEWQFAQLEHQEAIKPIHIKEYSIDGNGNLPTAFDQKQANKLKLIDTKECIHKVKVFELVA